MGKPRLSKTGWGRKLHRYQGVVRRVLAQVQRSDDEVGDYGTTAGGNKDNRCTLGELVAHYVGGALLVSSSDRTSPDNAAAQHTRLALRGRSIDNPKSL